LAIRHHSSAPEACGHRRAPARANPHRGRATQQRQVQRAAAAAGHQADSSLANGGLAPAAISAEQMIGAAGRGRGREKRGGDMGRGERRRSAGWQEAWAGRWGGDSGQTASGLGNGYVFVRRPTRRLTEGRAANF